LGKLKVKQKKVSVNVAQNDWWLSKPRPRKSPNPKQKEQ